jgi:hypothetical protein
MLKAKNFYKVLVVPVILLSSFVTVGKAQLENKEKINVFAVVSENIEQAFVKAAETLKAEEGLEAFPLQNYQIHCTLYMTMYPQNTMEKVLPILEKLASNTKEFSINSSGLEITAGNWFFMSLDRNRNLQTLADSVVNELSPLRSTSDFIPNWARQFPEKMENIKKFGSPNVFSEFNPHLTFLPGSDGEKLKRFYSKHKKSDFAREIPGKVIALGAGIADRNGQLKEAIKIFPLPKD